MIKELIHMTVVFRRQHLCFIGAKIKKWKCVKLNDYTKIIIEISHDRYFFACFALYYNKEPNKDKIYEENLLQITKNFIEIINLYRKWKNEKIKNIVLL